MDLTTELAQMAATGTFGTLHHGAHLADVVAAYGEPTNSGRLYKQRRWPHGFCFGSVQLVVCRCRLLSSIVFLAWHDDFELPGPSRGELRAVDSRVTESAMIAALTQAGCRWKVVEYERLTDQRTLEVEMADDLHVDFVFVDREGYDSPQLDDWVLHKAGIWGPSHAPCPEPDRSLPDDGYGA
ncbi:hypothetical protein [Kitasatospora sp. HPMI-4]|uniref:hypothetical protein n=1 Tax=Kitasatospora sp. HPMI-4 TaxID=3448443 RepID=UPI003F1CD23A